MAQLAVQEEETPGGVAPRVQEDRTGIAITNEEFLRAAFGGHYWSAYVVGFPDDPSAIVPERRGVCWGGGHFGRANGSMSISNNTYFDISLFRTVEGRAVRRRAEFLACYVFLIDDVGTKVPEAVAARLPPPSYKLETSPGNWQWGYFMPWGEPEVVRERVERLQDQFIKVGLGEEASDPGMKGVTRLGRLPGGTNTKAKYRDEAGNPWLCRMTYWAPNQRYTLDALAASFGIDLDVVVKDEGKVGDGVWPADSPVMQWVNENLIEQRNESEFLVVCPWVAEHTDGDDSGTWIRTLEDGSGEFKCHHGHCAERGFNDFLIETGLRNRHDSWKSFRWVQEDDTPAPAPAGEVDFLGAPPPVVMDAVWRAAIDGLPANPAQDTERLQRVIESIVALDVLDRSAAVQALKDRCRGYIQARDIDAAVRRAAGDRRAEQVQGRDQGGVLDEIVFVEEQGRYYRRSDNTLMTPDTFDRTYAHFEFWGEPGPLGDPPRLSASDAFDRRQGKKVANGLGWRPVDGDVFWWGRRSYANTYAPPAYEAKEGDVDAWLWLMRALCGDYWELVLKHMAYTVQFPDQKLRWQIFWFGKPRTGKSSLVAPLVKLFGQSAATVTNKDIQGAWGDHFFEKKVIVIEEVLQPDNRDFYNDLKARLVNNNVETLNIKGRSIVAQQNLYSMYMFSNYADALHFDDDDAKLLVIEAGVPFDDDEEKEVFFDAYHAWLDSGEGVSAIYHYLLNVDLNDFPVGRLPVMTDAYRKACREAKPDYQRRVIEMIECDEAPFGGDYVYFSTLKASLSAAGYRFSDRGLSQVLHQQGFRKLRGVLKEGGKVKTTPVFWSRRDFGEEPADIYRAFINSTEVE